MPSVIDVFKEGIDLVKDNYFSALGMYLILLVVVLIIGVIVAAGAVATVIGGITTSHTGTYATWPIVVIVAIVFAAMILVSPIWNGAYYSLAMQAMKKKGKASLGKAIRESSKVYKKLLWTSVIQIFITLAIMVIAFLPFAIYSTSLLPLLKSSVSPSTGTSTISSVISALGFRSLFVLLFLIITIIIEAIVNFVLGALFYEAMPLAMLNGTSGLAAIKKSVAIGRKYFWSIVGLMILTALFGVLVYAVMEIAFAILSIISPIVGLLAYFVILVILESFLVGLSGFLPIVFYKRYVNA